MRGNGPPVSDSVLQGIEAHADLQVASRLFAEGGFDDVRGVQYSFENPDTPVLAVSESGASTIQGVSGAVRTQSSAIELTQLGGRARVTSGSGSVTMTVLVVH